MDYGYYDYGYGVGNAGSLASFGSVLGAMLVVVLIVALISLVFAILMIIGLIFLILSPIFGKLMQLAVSRKREFLADATAVQFTRNPDGLISALQKISGDSSELKVANKATENMYIVTPFKNKKKSSNLWSTHPSIEERIEALKNLK